ncbi:hypothetical protein ACFBZI_11490 [Moraxella sp. ZJ142]|uniref:hypothetical protein n=1 Tax=Moraxella marmotae TaxID=3344520 RepID=UPI0035D4BB0B
MVANIVHFAIDKRKKNLVIKFSFLYGSKQLEIYRLNYHSHVKDDLKGWVEIDSHLMPTEQVQSIANLLKASNIEHKIKE